jgi:hypothetical protein
LYKKKAIGTVIYENQHFSDVLFENLEYEKWIFSNKLDELLKVDLNTHEQFAKQKALDPFQGVSPNEIAALAPELDDLCRLHFLICSRKVTTILEFGVGKSTIVFNDALLKNQKKYIDFVSKNLRRSNAFECHSVDNYKKWIDEVQKNNSLSNTTCHFSEVELGTFNDRVCTYYSQIPNICPDFIYLDGPDQLSPKGDIRGISTNHLDRMPMAADILALEHFLLPGTLIVTDGRTANARFLKSNLQRNWVYCHSEAFDQHFFELNETPLGALNRCQIDFSLGEGYYNRIKT